MSSSQAFNLLAQPIQKILWEMQWSSLRPIQESAINAILRNEADIVISANTASGKTEAAFLPILSRIFDSPKPSVQAVYVGPLKALINDQFVGSRVCASLRKFPSIAGMVTLMPAARSA